MVIVVCEESDPSPWVIYHSFKMVKTFDDALIEIKHIVESPPKKGGVKNEKK